MKTNIHFLSYLAQLFLEREMFQTNVAEKIKTHILCSVTFSRKSGRLRGNVEKCGTARQVTCGYTILHMTFACWTTKATQTLRIYTTYCFSTATMVTRTRLYVTLYVHCLSCCFLFLPPKSPTPLSPPNYSKILFHYTGVHF
jgi:hypothetical protein